VNPLSLITRGLLGDLIRVTKNYFFPLDITIDYGAKIIDVLVEENNLLVETEQELVTVIAGQEDLIVEIKPIDVEVKID
jgi:hypothetical protein